MNPLERAEIRKTGVQLTRLGLGGSPLSGTQLGGYQYGGTSYHEALQIIRRAYELGIRYFDTAPSYGEGRSEVRFGAALASWPRRSYIISTKVGKALYPAGDGSVVQPEGLPKMTVGYDVSRDGILRSLDESLKRLKTDHVEILLLHDPDVENLEAIANTAVFPTLLELRASGVVKAIGTGMLRWDLPLRFIQRFDLDVVLLAGRYTLLDHAGLRELLPECENRGVRVVIGAPYNSGILARDLNGPVIFDNSPAPPELIGRAKALKAVCDRHNVDLRAAALQFVLAHPAVAATIPGARSVVELEDNVRMASAEIPAGLWGELKAEKLIASDAPTPS